MPNFATRADLLIKVLSLLVSVPLKIDLHFCRLPPSRPFVSSTARPQAGRGTVLLGPPQFRPDLGDLDIRPGSPRKLRYCRKRPKGRGNGVRHSVVVAAACLHSAASHLSRSRGCGFLTYEEERLLQPSVEKWCNVVSGACGGACFLCLMFLAARVRLYRSLALAEVRSSAETFSCLPLRPLWRELFFSFSPF